MTFTIPDHRRLGAYKAIVILYEVETLNKDTVNGITEKNKHARFPRNIL